jgi:hypothetical protein
MTAGGMSAMKKRRFMSFEFIICPRSVEPVQFVDRRFDQRPRHADAAE